MNLSTLNPKTKMYLSIGLTMAVIFTIWIITLATTLKKIPAQNRATDTASNLSSQLAPLENQLSELFDNFEALKTALNQAATTSANSLQGGPQIKPEELSAIVEKLDLSTSTPTSTPTLPTTTPLNLKK